MKSLLDYSEFISENIVKFHNIINDYKNDEELEKEVGDFTSEMFNRACESIGIDISIMTDPDPKMEIVVAIFMRASELWHMFCSKYKEMYPDDPLYFDEEIILKGFESTYKEGLIKNEITE